MPNDSRIRALYQGQNRAASDYLSGGGPGRARPGTVAHLRPLGYAGAMPRLARVLRGRRGLYQPAKTLHQYPARIAWGDGR